MAEIGNINRTVLTLGTHDYVQDGVVHTGAATVAVMVTSSDDLTALKGYLPGTYAFTAGWKGVWQLAADGTWVDVMEVESGD